MKFDGIIIGGGAAGLTAALSASQQGARVLVLESAPRVGRKLLATGNGRCNLANMGPARYYGGADFAAAVLENCPVHEVLAFFAELGLVTCEEEGGRVYPGCGQAAAVLDVLRYGLERAGAEILCDAPAQKLEILPEGFAVTTPQGKFASRSVVLACGGMAGGKLGHDGKPYRLLTELGYDMQPPFPALTQLMAEKESVRGLSGLRLPAILTLWDGQSAVSASQGEVLFTDYGISGVCAMQLSQDAGALLRRGMRPVLYLDFSPMLGLVPRIYDRVPVAAPDANVARVRQLLQRRARNLPREDLLLGLCPRLLAQRLNGLAIPALAEKLAAYPVPILSVRGFDNAQVTAGGLDCAAFDPATMESRRHPGLFAVGEYLNVDGDCGGFNLQFAFASGILAGNSLAFR